MFISEIYSAVSISFESNGVITGGMPKSAGSSAEVADELKADLIYDHPFIYIVYDQNDLPIFIGNVVLP